MYIITPQARPLGVLITAIYEIYLIKQIDMVDTRSNMQLADLKSKPHVEKSIINLIDHAIVDRFYPTPGPEHYKLFSRISFIYPLISIEIKIRKAILY